MASLQQDIDDLDRMVDTGAQKDAIRSQIRLISREVATLEADYASLAEHHAKLKAAQTPPSIGASPEVLEDMAEQILKLIASDGDKLNQKEIFRRLALTKARGDYLFDQLEKWKFIEATHAQMGGSWFYAATAAGRDYLAQRGLL
jgi:DNA-binding MarR family transcriptional regulator